MKKYVFGLMVTMALYAPSSTWASDEDEGDKRSHSIFISLSKSKDGKVASVSHLLEPEKAPNKIHKKAAVQSAASTARRSHHRAPSDELSLADAKQISPSVVSDPIKIVSQSKNSYSPRRKGNRFDW